MSVGIDCLPAHMQKPWSACARRGRGQESGHLQALTGARVWDRGCARACVLQQARRSEPQQPCGDHVAGLWFEQSAIRGLAGM